MTAAPSLIPPDDRRDAKRSAEDDTKEAAEVLAMIEDMVITTPAELQFAVGAVVEIQEGITEVEGKISRVTSLAEAIIAEVKGWWAPALESMNASRTALRDKMSAHDLANAERRIRMLQAAGIAGAQGQPEEAGRLIAEAADTETAKIGGLSFRRTLDVAIADEARAVKWCVDNNRLDLLKLDAKAVSSYGKTCADKGLPIEVPGIAVTPKTSPTIPPKRVVRS